MKNNYLKYKIDFFEIIYYIMNINKLDQFYTNEKIAEKCIELFYKFVNVENYNYILEPSAGTGSFYNKLDKTKK